MTSTSRFDRSLAQDTPSIRLHGYPVSNWFNCVRAAMIEKGLGSDFVPCRAAQDNEFLAKSAMGKIPWLETLYGSIAESIAILEYLDEAYPERSIFPEDAFEKAKVRQIVNVIQLYIEAPMRRLYPATFMGGGRDEAPLADVMEQVDRAMAALDHLCDFTPFARGAALTNADLVLFYTLELGERAARHLANRSLFAGRPALQGWDAMMRLRASTTEVLSDFAAAFADYCDQRNAEWNEAQYQEMRFSHA